MNEHATHDAAQAAEAPGQAPAVGALSGIRVLDMSRVMAGPLCAQLLADLGADVIKIERPGVGDDSRAWGPPTLKDAQGNVSSESAYFHTNNRGKRSVTVDLSDPQGQEIVRRLACECDVLVENYKVGTLVRYGLDYATLSKLNPRLVYCSITGFGQTGPYAARAGYDTIVQAIGGLMSITGDPDREPQRVGVALIDVMTGLYGALGVLGALQHRHRSGAGQHIDLALLDVQVAGLANIGMNYLATGEVPHRSGNTNPTVQPSGVFKCKDGQVMIIVGNDGQFRSLCRAAGLEALLADPRFASNFMRVTNQADLHAVLEVAMVQRPVSEWMPILEAAGIPAGPINDIKQTFADPQVISRGAVVELQHDLLGRVPTLANPLRLSATPVQYSRAAPILSGHTEEVLRELLGMCPADILALAKRQVI